MFPNVPTKFRRRSGPAAPARLGRRLKRGLGLGLGSAYLGLGSEGLAPRWSTLGGRSSSRPRRRRERSAEDPAVGPGIDRPRAQTGSDEARSAEYPAVGPGSDRPRARTGSDGARSAEDPAPGRGVAASARRTIRSAVSERRSSARRASRSRRARAARGGRNSSRCTSSSTGSPSCRRRSASLRSRPTNGSTRARGRCSSASRAATRGRRRTTPRSASPGRSSRSTCCPPRRADILSAYGVRLGRDADGPWTRVAATPWPCDVDRFREHATRRRRGRVTWIASAEPVPRSQVAGTPRP